MRGRTVFFTKEQSLVLRGIAILMVITCHAAYWYTDLLGGGWFWYGLTKFGVYGVDLFYLVSGYGLVKSVSKRRVGWNFLWKRIKTTYLPYLLIVGLIELYAGGLGGAQEWFLFLTGYQYWFIRNILIFYLIFFVSCRLADQNWQRLFFIVASLSLYSWWLYSQGRASFWYLSNIAFVIGIVLAQYERKLLPVFKFFYLLQLLVLTGMMAFAAYRGLGMQNIPAQLPKSVIEGVLATVVWTLLCVQAARLIKKEWTWLSMLGGMSLELYLVHSFLYERTVNSMAGIGHLLQGIIALVLSVALAWLIHWMFQLLWDAAAALGGGKRK